MCGYSMPRYDNDFDSVDLPACATGKIRLYVDAPLNAGAVLTLDRDQSHYLATVMRQREGDALRLFNGRDGEWTAAITASGRRAVTLTAGVQTREQDSVPDLWLLFAPVKRARLDFLAQKATELGVAVLRPVFTRRTVVSRVNVERLAANVREAAEQCGRLTVPAVQEAQSLDAVLADWPAERRLVFCDEAGAGEPAIPPLREALEGRARAPWAILVGPEGGFDAAERDRLRALPQALRVSLGPRIMRADTAALAALAVWQAVLGDW
jgi:16S rRNA (uracil1498-N3)-methyltransferase